VMWIASCTKVVTALAALQCCERGLLSLDEPIYDVLPEFKGLPVLKRFNENDGSPVLEPHKKPITLRHMLNHSSGIAYDETHPKLLAWHKWHRTAPNRLNAVEGRFSYPLVFEPGESWFYGAGVDWAGVAVERVNGGMTLQRYFEENIFSRVGARDVVFSSYLYTRPDLQARVVDMSKRDPKNPQKVIRSNARLLYNDRGGCIGGYGLFASPSDYLKILRGILKTDEDQRLLSKEGVEEFFRPCLTDKAKTALNDILTVEVARIGMGNLPGSVTKNWALGGIVNEGDVPGGRKAGTMTWAGLPNLTWVSIHLPMLESNHPMFHSKKKKKLTFVPLSLSIENQVYAGFLLHSCTLLRTRTSESFVICLNRVYTTCTRRYSQSYDRRTQCLASL